MTVKLKLSSNEAKQLMDQFDHLSDKGVEAPLGLNGLLPNLPGGQTQAICLDVDPGKYWEFMLYWMGIPVTTVAAEVHGDQLILEDL